MHCYLFAIFTQVLHKDKYSRLIDTVLFGYCRRFNDLVQSIPNDAQIEGIILGEHRAYEYEGSGYAPYFSFLGVSEFSRLDVVE